MKQIIFLLAFLCCFLANAFTETTLCEKASSTFKTSFIQKSGSFTAMFFVKANGYTERNKKEWPNGMVVSCGSGYYDGWRVFLAEENNFVPFFEIGRPEIGAIALKADFGLSKGNIHHVAVSWNQDNPENHVMKIYIDGMLAGELQEVPVFPIFEDKEIVVGYNDFGVGELEAEIFGVKLINAPLSQSEINNAILTDINMFLTNNDDQAEILYKQAWALQNSTNTNQILTLINNFRNNLSNSDKSVPAELYKDMINLAEIENRKINTPKIYPTTTFIIPPVQTEAEFYTAFNNALSEIKKLRENGNSQPVEIQFPQSIPFLEKTITVENLSNVIFSSGDFCGENRYPLKSSESVISDPRFKSLNSEGPIVKINAPTIDKFIAYNCGNPHGKGFLVWKETTDAYNRPTNMILRSASYPEESFIDGKSDGTNIKLDAVLLNKLANEPHPQAIGYWKYFWADGFSSISISKENSSFTLNDSVPYGLGDTPRYRFMNIFSEMDKPDEYCADKDYIYTISAKSKEENLCITRKATPFFIFKNCQGIALRNLSFSGTLSPAIEIHNVDRLKITKTSFNFIGSSALLLNNVSNTIVSNCNFKNIGFCGLRIWAGNREKCISNAVVIKNSNFDNTGFLAKTYTPSIFMDGYGIIVNGCRFTNTPSSAMRIEGSAHIIKNCYFENNVLESDDQGTIDMWGDPTYRSCLFKNNIFKNVGDGSNQECGRAAIRFDDMISGMFVVGNKFINSSRGNFGAVQIHGGSHNLVWSNEFIDCNYGVSFTPRGEEIFANKGEELESKLKNYRNNPIFLEKHGSFKRAFIDYDVNFVFNNKFINCGKPFREKKSMVYFYLNTNRQD